MAAVVRGGGSWMRLFSGRGVVTYLGEFEHYEHFWAEAPDRSGLGVRQLVKFRLRKG